MIYSERTSVIKRAAEKMFLKFDQREMDFLAISNWDDMMNHLDVRYGLELQKNFEEILINVLKERKEKEQVKQ